MDDLKTSIVKIETGRDKGKVFQVKELPLMQADRWATRLLLGMARGGLDMSNVTAMNLDTTGGILEIAKFSVAALGNVNEDLALELIEEITKKCCMIVPESGIARQIEWGDYERNGDIWDMETLLALRKEAIGIHVDFLKQGAFSILNR